MRPIVVGACALLLGVSGVAALAATAPKRVETPAYISAAIADGARPDADKQRDADRLPVQMLSFAEVKPGEQIAELLPGGGYFTRLFSKAVGASGHVYALVPARSPDTPTEAPDFAARVKALAADPAYANVSVIEQPFGQLSAPQKVDLVWTSQNYHDLHNLPGLDVGIFNQLIFDTLKPGGLYVIVDHAAEEGSGLRDTGTLHRIDSATVKREVLAAGFEFVASSDVLRNAQDTRKVKVFDPSIRGRTDQFVLKFRKPSQH
jgi:predicted methyltransferase